MGSLSEAFKRELDGVMSRLKNVTERREKTINEKKQYLARIENIKKKGRLNFGEYFDSSKLSVEKNKSIGKNGLTFESKMLRKTNALRAEKAGAFSIKSVGVEEGEYQKALKDKKQWVEEQRQAWLQEQKEKQKKEDKEDKKKFFRFIKDIDNEEYSSFLGLEEEYLDNDSIGYKSVMNEFIKKQLKKDNNDFKQKKTELEDRLKAKEDELSKLKQELEKQKKCNIEKQSSDKQKLLSEKNKELMNKLKAKDEKMNKYRQYYKQKQKKLNEMQKNIINMKYKNSGKHKFK